MRTLPSTSLLWFVVIGGSWNFGCRPLYSQDISMPDVDLSKPISVEFDATPLHDAIGVLSETIGKQFHLDRRALADRGIKEDEPIHLKLVQVRADAVLDFLCESVADLDYGFRGGVVVISTREVLDAHPIVRVCPVAELLAIAERQVRLATPQTIGGGGWSPYVVDYLQVELNKDGKAIVKQRRLSAAEQLIDLIESSVSPPKWERHGGPGTIREFGNQLVVTNSRRVHLEVNSLLRQLTPAKAPELQGKK